MKHFAYFSWLFAFVLLLASCAEAPLTAVPPSATTVDHRILTPVTFDELSGWRGDHAAEALAAFRRSCSAMKNRAVAWKNTCADAAQVANDDTAARLFFENRFQPYAVAGRNGDGGLFTGYYAPELRGSTARGGAFQTPLYMRPKDRIEVDLGAFKPDLKGQHIIGKVAGDKLIPYDDRAEIAQWALAQRSTVLVWVDDPVAAFFLEIQGSGRIRLPDNTIMPVGYDGANGHGYTAIGRVLADRGDISRPVTMPAIQAWLAAHPEQAQKVMNENPSYVFFRRLPNDDVLGAQGIALTPRRSMAVDTAFIPLGAPVWLDTVDARGVVLQRLMIAQDTGGAIKGVVRGDFFWGQGPEAAFQAGAMQSRGRYFLLLPKELTVNE